MSTDHDSTDRDKGAGEASESGETTGDLAGSSGQVADVEFEDIIRAAGCVVYREGIAGPEVLVVHRPRYDDWDLPKGKRDPGESDLECAIRETKEESGYEGEIERELASDTYRVRGRDKLVRWYLMRCTGGEFEPNDEVDRIQWLTPDQAREILSYGHARSLVDVIDGAGADI